MTLLEELTDGSGPHTSPHTGALAGTDRLDTRFRAMGTDCHVVLLDGGHADLDAAVHHVRELESRWSRFLDSSDVSRLNHAGGEPVIVGGPTRLRLQRAVDARTRTRGWFDPFLARALEAQGYDRDFSLLDPPLPVDDAAAHHVLDPRTGRPADICVASVSVTAPEAWLAETLTTAVMLAGPVFGAALLRRAGADALVVSLDGTVGRL